MNKKTSWDHSLVKKYGSSNHFKMLNQLRNEVIKYPLYRKKNISSNLSVDTKNEINNKEKKQKSNDTIIKNNRITTDIDNNKSTVSFNNSKDFSIYNNMTINKNQDQEDIKISDQKNTNDGLSNSTFKDRLEQVDLK